MNVIGKATSLEMFHGTIEVECGQPLKARDFKDPQVVIYELSENNWTADGVGLSETWNAGSSE